MCPSLPERPAQVKTSDTEDTEWEAGRRGTMSENRNITWLVAFFNYSAHIQHMTHKETLT